MEEIDISREYMYIFKEQFDYLDVLTPVQFYELFRMIRDLRFNGVDTDPKDVEDLMLRGIWISLRTQVLTSARNARKYKKRQENKKAQNCPESGSDVQTPVPIEITQNNPLSVANKGTSLEEIFRNKIRENKQENIKWIIKYDTFIDCLTENPDLVEWATENGYNGQELEKIWNKFKENYNNQIKR
jgi:hypothetical protein